MFVINTLLPRGVCVSLCERVGVPNTGATPRPRRDGTMRRAGGKANRTSPGAHPCKRYASRSTRRASLSRSLETLSYSQIDNASYAHATMTRLLVRLSC